MKKQIVNAMKATGLTVIIIMAGATQANDAFNNPSVTTKDLGPFALSVKKFTDKNALNKHHEHLLQQANNPELSVIERYTYAMLLGINEPTPLTRQMAIEALGKLENDPNLSVRDHQTINNIRNLMIYKQNQMKQ
ncbi:MAG: hypothetical protein A3F10_01155 [Coxiella sp. RIFCSPHIGHO2_12_FULL_42_15]|nr:MAG: hypothetical protein A3F10_01155 [Coxiella sp. RIFCSPHIGHO2_12_FULL_42_15]